MTTDRQHIVRAGRSAAAACVLVGAVFIVAAVLKTVRPDAAVTAITDALTVGHDAGLILGAALVGAEMLIGLALWAPRWRHAGRIGAVALLSVFTVYLVALRAPDAPSCGCFGLDSASPVASSATLGVTRNLALLAALALRQRAPPAHWNNTTRTGDMR